MRPKTNIQGSEIAREPVAPPTVGFRLDDGSRRVLAQRADALGVSPHELARHYVVESLQEAEERAALREAILQLRQ